MDPNFGDGILFVFYRNYVNSLQSVSFHQFFVDKLFSPHSLSVKIKIQWTFKLNTNIHLTLKSNSQLLSLLWSQRRRWRHHLLINCLQSLNPGFWLVSLKLIPPSDWSPAPGERETGGPAIMLWCPRDQSRALSVIAPMFPKRENDEFTEYFTIFCQLRWSEHVAASLA